MPRGRIPYKDYAEIGRLDVSATDANMNPVTREKYKVITSEDQGREEMTTVTIRCAIEYDRTELERMTRGGDIPDGAIGLVVHMRDMERGDGTDSYVNSDGSLIFKKDDRLLRTLDRRGSPIDTFNGNPKPKLYCTEIHSLYSSLGRHGPNLRLLLFGDRPTGRL